MKQKTSRGSLIKTENVPVLNTPAQRGKRILPEGASRKRFNREGREADGGVPLVRFKLSNGGKRSSSAPESRGGRRRRSTARQGDRRVPPCSGRHSASVGGGGGRRRVPRRRRALLRRTAARVVEGLVGEGCRDQIEEGVRLLVARGSN